MRGGGTSVWVLTYPDVKGALAAVANESAMAAITPLSSAVRHHAVQGAKQLRGEPHAAFDALDFGTFDQLMAYLANPDPLAWQQLAQMTALAAGASGTAFPVDDIQAAIQAAATGGSPTPAAHETDARIMAWSSQGGQKGVTALEKGDASTQGVVLVYDSSIDTDRGRWSDWLHLGNLLQYMGSSAVISTTSLYDAEPFVAPQPVENEPAVLLDELLVDVVDASVRALAAIAVKAGFTELEVGYETGDEMEAPIEVAWPAAKVGILVTGSNRPGGLEDWDLRDPTSWTEGALLEALTGNEA